MLYTTALTKYCPYSNTFEFPVREPWTKTENTYCSLSVHVPDACTTREEPYIKTTTQMVLDSALKIVIVFKSMVN